MANVSNSSETITDKDNILLRDDFRVPHSYVVGMSGLFLWTFLTTIIIVKAEHAEISLTEGGSTTALQYIQISVCNTVTAGFKLLENILQFTNASCTSVLVIEQFFNIFHAASVLQVVILAIQRLVCFQFPIWSNQYYKSRGFRISTFSVYPIAVAVEIVGFVQLGHVDLIENEYCFGSEYSFQMSHDKLAITQYWLRFAAVRSAPCMILLPVIVLSIIVVLKNYRQRIKLRNVNARESFLNDSVFIFMSFTTFFIETLYIIMLTLDYTRKSKATGARNVYRHLVTDAILLLTYTWYFFYHTLLGTKERKYVHKWRNATISSLTRPSRYFTVRKKKKARKVTVSCEGESHASGVRSVVSMNQESSASGILEREL
ncbi:uncharacterized protein LOC133196591 [Saccostrea echinata]|uniref:uncharacterized protein LOC133196591 n=1 Tax=Saccostrea echinata TaxID=191078 RepID=UPI002A80BBA5|nr:uncharacterized protein LOC133196591 [Saccostrea echinata]